VEDFHRKTCLGTQDGAHDAGVKRCLKLYSPTMAKVCHVCSKGPAFGNSRSHSMVATRRRFDPNLQRVRIDDNGTPRRVYVCTRCLKAGKVTKAA
jgi:large subunit ribosomal protein L28